MKRRRVRVSVHPERPLDAYYESISERFGITQVLLYLSLLVFVVLSLIGNTELLTYQNFYYFFKDLGASAETVDVLHTDSLSYPTDSAQSFTLYRQGLAIAGNTSVTVFTPSGRQTLSRMARHRACSRSPQAVSDRGSGCAVHSCQVSFTRVMGKK